MLDWRKRIEKETKNLFLTFEIKRLRRLREISWPETRRLLLSLDLVPDERLPLMFPKSDLLDLSGLRISGLDTPITSLDLSFCNLSSAKIDNIKLRTPNFSYSKIHDSSITNSEFSDGLFFQTEFDSSQLKNLTFLGFCLARASFKNIDGTRLHFLPSDSGVFDHWNTETSMEEVVFDGARIISSFFGNNTDIQSFLFTLNMNRSSFRGSTLIDTTFKTVTLNKSNFKNAILVNCRFDCADLRGLIDQGVIWTGIITKDCEARVWKLQEKYIRPWTYRTSVFPNI